MDVFVPKSSIGCCCLTVVILAIVYEYVWSFSVRIGQKYLVNRKYDHYSPATNLSSLSANDHTGIYRTSLMVCFDSIDICTDSSYCFSNCGFSLKAFSVLWSVFIALLNDHSDHNFYSMRVSSGSFSRVCKGHTPPSKLGYQCVFFLSYLQILIRLTYLT